MNRRIGKASAHRLASMRTGKMHVVAFCGSDEIANVIQPLLVEPAFATAALDSKAIGGFLVGTAKLMSALVRIDPQHDRLRQPQQQLRVQDDEARIRCPVVIEIVVDDGRSRTAPHAIAVDAKFAGGNDVSGSVRGCDVLFDGRTAIGKRRRAGGRYQQAGISYE